MSCRMPGSLSLTKTPAVMCIAETRTMPSFTPLFCTLSATGSVILTYSRCFAVLNQR